MSTLAADAPRLLAIAGNPNCGKTALFNRLTGARQKVANFPGVTVDVAEGTATLPSGRRLDVVDVPGSYSLDPRSPDEAVARDLLLGTVEGERRPDAVLAVVNAANLEVTLRFVLDLKALGRPVLVALNMIDVARHRGLDIDPDALSDALGVPVVPTVAVRRGGLDHLLERLDALAADLPDGQPSGAAADEDVAAIAGDAARLRAQRAEIRAILASTVRTTTTKATVTRRLDAVLLHPVAGPLILLAILFVMFQAVFSWSGWPMDQIDAAMGWLGDSAAALLPGTWIESLVVDGIIAGVGSVLIFLPQIVILFAFILILEDLGYMARAAFLLDRLMGVAGLNGRAFIPLLSSFACAIPGIMATRAIANPRDRLTTILVAPLMACSARIPVYVLVIGAFIPATTVGPGLSVQGLVLFGLYASGIIAAIAVAAIIRLGFLKGRKQPLLLELPAYQVPDPGTVLRNLGHRAGAFLKRAGTLIMAITVILWALSSWPGKPADAPADDPAVRHSLAGRIGSLIEPVLAPIGFDWRVSIALVPGLAAREVVVSALGTVYALEGAEEEIEAPLTERLQADWSLASALALLAWYVFAPQCLATLAVARRETTDWRVPYIMFGYLTGLAWLAAFLTYRIALALGAG